LARLAQTSGLGENPERIEEGRLEEVWSNRREVCLKAVSARADAQENASGEHTVNWENGPSKWGTSLDRTQRRVQAFSKGRGLEKRKMGKHELIKGVERPML